MTDTLDEAKAELAALRWGQAGEEMTQSAVPGALDIGRRLQPQPRGQISPAPNAMM